MNDPDVSLPSDWAERRPENREDSSSHGGDVLRHFERVGTDDQIVVSRAPEEEDPQFTISWRSDQAPAHEHAADTPEEYAAAVSVMAFMANHQRYAVRQAKADVLEDVTEAVDGRLNELTRDVQRTVSRLRRDYGGTA